MAGRQGFIVVPMGTLEAVQVVPFLLVLAAGQADEINNGVDIIEVIPHRFTEKVAGGAHFLPEAAIGPLQPRV
jgi:hypothetical protein